jgi:hypothetical protein
MQEVPNQDCLWRFLFPPLSQPHGKDFPNAGGRNKYYVKLQKARDVSWYLRD